MNLTAVPFHNSKVSMNIHDTLGYVIDPLEGKIRVLNPTGVDIWNTINGCNSILDIINEVSNTYEYNSQVIQIDVINFLLQLKERSLIYLKEE